MANPKHIAALRGVLARDSETEALSPITLLLLGLICTGPGKTTADLADEVSRSRAQVWRLIGLLTRRGLVTRSVDSSDARRQVIVPTKAGISLDARVQSLAAGASGRQPATQRTP